MTKIEVEQVVLIGKISIKTCTFLLDNLNKFYDQVNKYYHLWCRIKQQKYHLTKMKVSKMKIGLEM